MNNDRPHNNKKGGLAVGALLAAFLGAASYQFSITLNEYNQMPEGYPFGFPGYLVTETFRDISNATTSSGNGYGHAFLKYAINPARTFAGMEPIPLADKLMHLIPVCVPDSLADRGWYRPAPGGRMEAYKDAAEQFVAAVARSRAVPGSPYNTGVMRGKNIAAFIDPAIATWTPHGKPPVDIRIVEGPLGSVCKDTAGFSGRYGITVARVPKKVPLIP